MIKYVWKPLLDTLNSLDGYSNRYRVVMHAERQSGEARRVMLVKAEGKLDRRETGWILPDEMLSFLQGFIAGHNAAHRRVIREITPKTYILR